jgi:hypothetical protein
MNFVEDSAAHTYIYQCTNTPIQCDGTLRNQPIHHDVSLDKAIYGLVHMHVNIYIYIYIYIHTYIHMHMYIYI